MSVIFTFIALNVNISDMIHVGEQIRAARKSRGVTQQQLADRIGMSRPSLIDYEKGKTPVTVDLLTNIADALDVPFIVDGYMLSKRVASVETRVQDNQLCFEFETEQTFHNAIVRIKPMRDVLTITAVLRHRSVS